MKIGDRVELDNGVTVEAIMSFHIVVEGGAGCHGCCLDNYNGSYCLNNEEIDDECLRKGSNIIFKFVED